MAPKMAYRRGGGYTGAITLRENPVSGKFGEKYYDLTLNALRIVAGLLFMTHGGMKLFGWFGAQGPMAGVWLFGVAGVLEVVGGVVGDFEFFSQYVGFVV